MSNLTKTLSSGSLLVVTPAGFKEAHDLFKVVAKEVSLIDFENDTVGKLDLCLTSSEAVGAALWPCMNRATYNGLRISPELFENDEARSDFLIVAKEVLVFNLTPFLKGLGSHYVILFQKLLDIQT